ncbi:MAG: UvrB/UvrC motif-containing protein [Puniceicoccales bacterium]|jgi:protein arginine kinase activator|nr:UvrB/UvrC motif-containing protein [Puniceicoccales bacterium]
MTQIVNGKMTAVHMCGECAAKHGLFDKEGLPFAMLSTIGEALFAGIKKSASMNGLICSKCGCTPMSFKETGRLGCPNCYKDLKPLVDGIVESSQKGMVHSGKVPKSRTTVEVEKALAADKVKCGDGVGSTGRKVGKRGSVKGRVGDLQKMLDEAIRDERYEEAAALRDEIRKLKK